MNAQGNNTKYFLQKINIESPEKISQEEADTSSDNKKIVYDNEAKDEPDFIETNCHWKNCVKEFQTQDELVRVSRNDEL